MTDRIQKLRTWLDNELALVSYELTPASEDASFRRYFRVHHQDRTFIVMDAPPDKEDCSAFLDVTERLRNSGLHAPEVYARDLQQGFLLLEDLGSVSYLQQLNADNVDELYGDAMAALLQLQGQVKVQGLPLYDEALLMQEMQLFPDWLLGEHLGVSIGRALESRLQSLFSVLAENALAQPAVFVHRDYHSRNLMVHDPNPGIIDYQDAVLGPVTYDLVSLLKDCYVKWPADQVQGWLAGYHSRFCESTPSSPGIDQFTRWFDLMGVQRHLKASGIFARLCHRDGKPGYLADIPRTLSYIVDLEEHYDELDWLVELIKADVLPGLLST